MTDDVPLVLGGHTFIEELGNDPAIDDAQARDVVAACLDSGITWFDTTYAPEREALGRALDELGRREEATIVAWNFFGPAHSAPVAYEPEHVDVVLDQLRTDRVERLVVHPWEEDGDQVLSTDLPRRWQSEGLVGELGTWNPDSMDAFDADDPFSFVVEPYNVARRAAAETFAGARALGWETLAVSPFVRGWTLDDLVAAAVELEGGDADDHRARLADHMLRFSLYGPDVDRLVVAMRRVEYVSRNVESARKGPLDDDERDWLERVYDRADVE